MSCFPSFRLSASLQLHQRIKNNPKCFEILAKSSCLLSNGALIKPTDSSRIHMWCFKELKLSIAELCNTLDFFLTSGKMSCVSLAHTVLSSSNFLYAENDSAYDCFVYVTQKNSEQRISEGLFSHNSPQRRQYILAFNAYDLWFSLGRRGETFGEKGDSHSVVHVIEPTTWVSKNNNS